MTGFKYLKQFKIIAHTQLSMVKMTIIYYQI